MGDERVIRIEITGHDTSVGLVAILRIGPETVPCIVALGAVTARIGVADELDMPRTANIRRQQIPARPEQKRVNRRTPFAGLGTFLKT